MTSVLAKAELITDPFPHCVVFDALPDDEYQSLLEARPKDAVIARDDRPNVRHDLPGVFLLDTMGPPWGPFVEYHTSRAFLDEIVSLFPILEAIGGIHGSCGVRGKDRYDVDLDCQIGVNTPTPERSRVRGPHVDNPVELFGGMLYMGEGEGDLILYRWKGEKRFHDKAEIDDDLVEEVSKVPYRHNTAVFFVNSLDSVHGVSERGPTKEFRRLVNFVGEVHYPQFELPR